MTSHRHSKSTFRRNAKIFGIVGIAIAVPLGLSSPDMPLPFPGLLALGAAFLLGTFGSVALIGAYFGPMPNFHHHYNNGTDNYHSPRGACTGGDSGGDGGE